MSKRKHQRARSGSASRGLCVPDGKPDRTCFTPKRRNPNMCNPVRRLLPLSMAWVCLAATPALAQNDNNGFPPGTHYTLNIQGKTNCAGDDLTGSNRHTIQVLLNVSGDISKLVDKTNKIYLQPGDPGSQPQVLDGNACDQGEALIQLPINE